MKRESAKVELAKGKQITIASSLQMAKVSIADRSIAKFFYAHGISFAVANTEADSYYREMVAAIRETPTSYVPPSYARLGGPLLNECYDNLQQRLKQRDPDDTLKEKFGCAHTYQMGGTRLITCHSLTLPLSVRMMVGSSGALSTRAATQSQLSTWRH